MRVQPIDNIKLFKNAKELALRAIHEELALLDANTLPLWRLLNNTQMADFLKRGQARSSEDNQLHAIRMEQNYRELCKALITALSNESNPLTNKLITYLVITNLINPTIEENEPLLAYKALLNLRMNGLCNSIKTYLHRSLNHFKFANPLTRDAARYSNTISIFQQRVLDNIPPELYQLLQKTPTDEITQYAIIELVMQFVDEAFPHIAYPGNITECADLLRHTGNFTSDTDPKFVYHQFAKLLTQPDRASFLKHSDEQNGLVEFFKSIQNEFTNNIGDLIQTIGTNSSTIPFDKRSRESLARKQDDQCALTLQQIQTSIRRCDPTTIQGKKQMINTITQYFDQHLGAKLDHSGQDIIMPLVGAELKCKVTYLKRQIARAEIVFIHQQRVTVFRQADPHQKRENIDTNIDPDAPPHTPSTARGPAEPK